VRTLDRIGLALFLLLLLVVVLAPVTAPFSPSQKAGAPLAPPNGSSWFGTDEVGHDILSRVIYGARSSLLGAFLVITSGVIVGGLVGLVAGAVRVLDSFLMRITDVFLALPAPLLAIAMVAALGPGYGHTLLAVSIVWWPWYARIVRGEIAALWHRPHTEAALLAKVPKWRLWFRHLLPGAIPELIVVASLDVGGLILMLAGLSFLGLGAPAPAAELGSMSAQGLRFLLSSWWVPVIPALAIALIAFLSNLVGDAIRDMTAARE
jgi:ABC-type dipeptide/oligopeptide/nickel transport system permease subunit